MSKTNHPLKDRWISEPLHLGNAIWSIIRLTFEFWTVLNASIRTILFYLYVKIYEVLLLLQSKFCFYFIYVQNLDKSRWFVRLLKLTLISVFSFIHLVDLNLDLRQVLFVQLIQLTYRIGCYWKIRLVKSLITLRISHLIGQQSNWSYREVNYLNQR